MDQPRRRALHRGARGRSPGAAGGARALERARGPDVRPRAAGHDRGCSAAVRGAARRARTRSTRRGGAVASTPSSRRLRADPFCVPQLDRFLADGEVWVDPDALALLQEIREQHARAAGLVALSARPTAFDALIARPRRRAEAVPARGRQLPARAPACVPRRRAGPRQDDRGARGGRGGGRLPGGGRVSGEPQAQLAARARALAAAARSARRRCPATAARAGRRGRGGWHDADITVVNYDIVAARLERALRAGTAGARARRVPLLQERRRQAHAGGAAAVGGGPARGPRAGAERYAGDEPPGGADLPAAHHRAPGGLRLGRALRRSASAAPTLICACTGTCARAASCAG